MPVNLDAIVDKASSVSRPRPRRWLIIGLIFLLIGIGLTFWHWPDERSGGRFWLSALGMPTLLWAMLFVWQRFTYKSLQVMNEGWDSEREALRTAAIQRGQRCACLVKSKSVTALSLQGVSLPGAIANKTHVISMIDSRHGTPGIRHTHLQSQDDEATLFSLLTTMMSAVIVDLNGTLAQLSDSMDCYLVLDIDANLSPEDSAACRQNAIRQFSRPVTLLEMEGLTAFDSWLDLADDRASALLVICAQLHDHPQQNSGEAIVGVLLSNRLLEAFPDSPIIHRIELGPPEETPRLLDSALLWGGAQPNEAQMAWLTGASIQQDPVWRKTCEARPFPFKTPDCPVLDNVIGYTGIAAPWLVLILAAEQAVQEKAAQLIAFDSMKQQRGVGLVSPPVNNQK